VRGEQDLHWASAMSHFSTAGEISLAENAWMVLSKCIILNTIEEGKQGQAGTVPCQCCHGGRNCLSYFQWRTCYLRKTLNNWQILKNII